MRMQSLPDVATIAQRERDKQLFNSSSAWSVAGQWLVSGWSAEDAEKEA